MKTAQALRDLITAVNDYQGQEGTSMYSLERLQAKGQLERAMEEGVRVLKRDPEVCHSCFADSTWHILCPHCGAVQ